MLNPPRTLRKILAGFTRRLKIIAKLFDADPWIGSSAWSSFAALVRGTGKRAKKPTVQLGVEQLEVRLNPTVPMLMMVSPNSGAPAGGATVSISGSNFTGATLLDFGTVPANFMVMSDSSISATSPAESAGTVDITIRNASGTSTIGSQDHYTFAAVPVITGLSPAQGPTAGGQAVTITGTGLSAATSVYFGTFMASFTINSSTQITATSPPVMSSSTVDVTVQAAEGTSGTSSADRYIYGSATVNHAPVGTANTVTTPENFGYAFALANFGFTDPNDSPANNFKAVKIATLPGAGTLSDNGMAVATGTFVSVSDISGGHLVFTPAANAYGTAYASFTFQVQDDGGTANGGVDTDTTARTMTLNVSGVNHAPVGTANTVTTLENIAYPFALADFGFSDPNDSPANNFKAVKIAALPMAGTLSDNGMAVAAGTFVGVSDISAAHLVFTPAPGVYGAAYASFTFQVQDDGGTANGGVDTDPTARAMTLNVTGVNHAPYGTAKTVTALENLSYAFAVADFGFSDPLDTPANNFKAVKIAAVPMAGTLADNGAAVAAGTFVALSDISAGHLVFTPAANVYGTGYASFTFQVQDDGGTANGGVDTDPSARTMTVNVAGVNHAPVGTANTLTTLENAGHTFALADFGFSDPLDTPANNFKAVKVATLPVAGTLTDNGMAVAAATFVSAIDVSSGHLVFTPAAFASGSGYATFTFQVQDDGGTANGGADTDPTPRSMALNVTAVNQAPVGSANTVTTPENSAYPFALADFGFSDPHDTPANNFKAVKIATLPGAGTLSDNGVAVTAGAFVSVADINAGHLVFAPATGVYATGYATFTFQVQDDGGTANGGVDTDTSPRSMTINVAWGSGGIGGGGSTGGGGTTGGPSNFGGPGETFAPPELTAIGPVQLGATVSPTDPQLAAVWSGSGASWLSSATGTAVTTSAAGQAATGATPAGGQYRLPGAAAPSAPANQLTGQVTDQGWLNGLTTNVGAAAYPVDPTSPPLGLTALLLGMPGYALQNGGNPIPSPAGGNSTWNTTYTLTNPDGSITTVTSAGQSTVSNGLSNVQNSDGTSTITGSQEADTTSTNSTVTTDAAGNLLASHTETIVAHYYSTTATTSSTNGAMTTLTTLVASGSDDSTDIHNSTVQQTGSGVTDSATVATTDTRHSDYSLNETDGSTSSGLAGDTTPPPTFWATYAYALNTSGSHHLHAVGTATLAGASGTNGTETYAYDEQTGDISAYTENGDSSLATPTLTSTYNDARNAAATWDDQGQSDVFTASAVGSVNDEMTDAFTGHADFSEAFTVTGSSNNGTFTVEVSGGGTANRSTGDAGSDTFHTAATLAGQAGTAIGAEQFSAGNSASVTASSDRVAVGGLLQSLTVAGAYTNASNLDTTGTVTSASPTSNVGGIDAFTTHRATTGQDTVAESGDWSGLSWTLDASNTVASTQDDAGSETYQSPSDPLGLSAALANGGLGDVAGLARQLFASGASLNAGQNAGTDTFTSHQDSTVTATVHEALAGTPIVSLLFGLGLGDTWSLAGFTLATQTNTNANSATNGTGSLTGAGASGLDSASVTFAYTTASTLADLTQQTAGPSGATWSDTQTATNASTQTQAGTDQASDSTRVPLGLNLGWNLSPTAVAAGITTVPTGVTEQETEAGAFSDTSGGSEILNIARTFVSNSTGWTLTGLTLDATSTGTFADAGNGTATVTETGSSDNETGGYTVADNGTATVHTTVTGDASGLSIAVDRGIADSYTDGDNVADVFNDTVDPSTLGSSGGITPVTSGASIGSALMDAIAGTASASELFRGNEQDAGYQAYTFAAGLLLAGNFTDLYTDTDAFTIANAGNDTDTETGTTNDSRSSTAGTDTPGTDAPATGTTTGTDTVTEGFTAGDQGTDSLTMRAWGPANNYQESIDETVADNFTDSDNGGDNFSELDTNPATANAPSSSGATHGADSWSPAASGDQNDQWTGNDAFNDSDTGTGTVVLHEDASVVNNVAAVTVFSEDDNWNDNFNESDSGSAADIETGNNNTHPGHVSEVYFDSNRGTDSTRVHYQGTPTNYTATVNETGSATSIDAINGSDDGDQTFNQLPSGGTDGAPGTPSAPSIPGSTLPAGVDASVELTDSETFTDNSTDNSTAGLQETLTFANGVPTVTAFTFAETDNIGFADSDSGTLGHIEADAGSSTPATTTPGTDTPTGGTSAATDNLHENFSGSDNGTDVVTMSACGSGASYQESIGETVVDNFNGSDDGTDSETGVETNPATANTPSGTATPGSWSPAASTTQTDFWTGTAGFTGTDTGSENVVSNEIVSVVNNVPTVTGFTEDENWIDNFTSGDSGSAADSETGNNNTTPGHVSEAYTDNSRGTDSARIHYQGTPDNYTESIDETDNSTSNDAINGSDSADQTFNQLVSGGTTGTPTTAGGNVAGTDEVTSNETCRENVNDTANIGIHEDVTFAGGIASVADFTFNETDNGGFTDNNGGTFGSAETENGTASTPATTSTRAIAGTPAGTDHETDGVSEADSGTISERIQASGTPDNYTQTTDETVRDNFGANLALNNTADATAALDATNLPAGSTLAGATEADHSIEAATESIQGNETEVIHDVEQVVAGVATNTDYSADLNTHEHDGISDTQSGTASDTGGATGTDTPSAPGSATDGSYLADSETDDDHTVITGAGGNLTATVDDRVADNINQGDNVAENGMPAGTQTNGATITDGTATDGETGTANVTSHDLFTFANGVWTLTSQTVTGRENDQTQSADSGDEAAAGSTSGTDTPGAAGSDAFMDSINSTGGAALQLSGDATNSTEGLDENRTINFTDTVPALGTAPADNDAGTATFTLHRDIIYAADGTATLSNAVLNVTGSFTDAVAGAATFQIDVTGNPTTGFTTTVTETGTNAFATLNVTVTADAAWLDDFINQIDSSITAACGVAQAGGTGGTVVSTQSGTDGGPTVTHNLDGSTRTQTFDANNHRLSDVTVDSTGHVTSALTYDTSGNVLSQTNADGSSTVNTYDTAGHKTSQTVGAGTADAATTTYGYTNGNLTSVTDPDGNTTYYGYDTSGRQTSMTDPLGNVETRGYDEAGRLAWVIDRDSQLTTYAYDATGNLITETMYTGSTDTTAVVDTLTWTYNADGTVATAGNNQGTYAYQYDGSGRVIHVDEPSGVSLTFGYDAAGNRVLVEDSLGGVEQSTYNANRQLTSRTLTQGDQVLRIDFTYTPQGQIATETRYSDAAGTQLVATTTYTYDPAANITSIVSNDAAGTPIANYAYTTDAAGDLTSQTENGVTSNFGYDAQGELTSTTTDGTTDANSYEANGNRTNTGYVTGPDNELLSDGTWNYSYDPEGNETEKVNIATGVTWTYGYNNRNEMTEAKEWTEDPAHYNTAYVEVQENFKYDVYSNRIEQDLYRTGPATSSAEVTKFAVDGWNPAKGTPVGNENFDVWADLNASGGLQTRYLRGDAVDQLLARVDNSGSSLSPYWELTDRLGSIRDVIDNSGAVKDAVAYDSFGNITSETNPDYRGHYAWTGREFDVETDLQYNRARYYDATTGRWISQDPLGFDAGDSNLYRYVRDAPTNATDPTGEQFGSTTQGPQIPPWASKALEEKITREWLIEQDRIYQAEKSKMFSDMMSNLGKGVQPTNPSTHGPIKFQKAPFNGFFSVNASDLYQMTLGIGSATTRVFTDRYPEGDIKRPPGFYFGKTILAPLLMMKAMPSELPGGAGPRLGAPSPRLALPGGGAIAVPGALSPAIPVPGIVAPGLGGGMFNTEGPPARPPRLSANWRARAATDPACQTGCENAARQIQQHVGGDIVRIRARAPAGVDPETLNLGAYRGHNARWNYHEVVVRNGRVYDAFTGHEGLSIAEYQALWENAAAIEFGF
jgi:RHS repeat-associated protein